MEPDPAGAAFARFAQSGDPAAMAEVFDRTAPELRALARRLSKSASEADDLIQETFLAAITGRDTFDPARPLVPWLVGILVRQARAARRRRGREVEPERVVVPVSSEPADESERREFDELLLEALGRLSARDREVLVPLLLDGRRAVQIARELGRRPDSVRMRVHRGLERLRRLLPPGLALPAWLPLDRWTPGAHSLRLVRESIVRAAARETGVAALPTVSASGALGIGSAGIGWAALLLVLVGVAAWRLGRSDVRDDEALAKLAGEHAVAEDGPSDAADGLSRDRRATVNAPATDLARAVRSPSSATPPPLTLTGRVRTPALADPTAARVIVRGLGPEPISEVLETRPDARGEFALDVARLIELGARRLEVEADHPACLPTRERALVPAPPRPAAAESRARPESTDAAPEATETLRDAEAPRTVRDTEVARTLRVGDLELLPASVCVGSVLGPDGAPLSGTTVGLFSLAPGNQDVLPVDSATTAADGSFRLRAPRDGRYVMLSHREGLSPGAKLVDLTHGALDTRGAVDLGAVRLFAGPSITGRVEAGTEGEVLGTLVRCEALVGPGERRLRLAGRRFLQRGDRCELATALAVCDARGAFAFEGLGPSVHRLSIEREPSAEALPARAGDASLGTVEARAPSFDVVLHSPWARFEFDWETLGEGRSRELVELGLALDLATGDGRVVRLRPDESGRARLQLVPGTSVRATLHGCSANGASVIELEAPAAGEWRRVALGVDPTSTGASLVLALEPESGLAGERLGLGFSPITTGFAGANDEAAPLFTRDVVVGPSGEARLDGLPSGAWRVEVRSGGTFERSFGFELPLRLELELHDGVSERRAVRFSRGGLARIVVRSSTGAHQTARLSLSDASGRSLPARLVAIEPEEQSFGYGTFVLERWNELGPLAPGRYRLRVEALWHEPRELDFEIRPGEVVALDARLSAR